MKFTQRMNKSTNLMEAVAHVEATVESIETSSNKNSNEKEYGFIHARNSNGDLLTGIAYKKTEEAYNGSATVGNKVMLEALATEVGAGINNHWNLTLPSASPVSASDAAAAKAFLASLG